MAQVDSPWDGKFVSVSKEPIKSGGILNHWHNFAPTPFNPDYDPRAAAWSTLATYDALLTGVYDDPMKTQEDRKAIRDAAYLIRKSKGNYSKTELKTAQEFIYNR